MAKKVVASVPRGMRDILPEQMIRRQYVIDVIRGLFEEFGFEPLSTPAVELADTLMGKYGPDAERLIYNATYGDGKDRLALRYDLSVPLCRVVSMYPDLVKPFKRYQIAPVWRAERPQKGRYREFYQCDVDIVGSTSMLADAEVIGLAFHCLRHLGFASFRILLNNRKLLRAIANRAEVPKESALAAWRAVDKWEK